MIIWMLVTNDKYELPVCIADTAEELSRLSGFSVNSIRASVAHVKSGRQKSSIFKKIELEDEA